MEEDTISFNTYVNICGFFGVDDVLTEDEFRAERTIKHIVIDNKNTNMKILLLCLIRKYDKNNVSRFVNGIKQNIQLIIVNESSFDKVVKHVVSRDLPNHIDICYHDLFVISDMHILSETMVMEKHSKQSYIEQERAGIPNDTMKLKPLGENDTGIQKANLRYKNLFLTDLYNFATQMVDVNSIIDGLVYSNIVIGNLQTMVKKTNLETIVSEWLKNKLTKQNKIKIPDEVNKMITTLKGTLIKVGDIVVYFDGIFKFTSVFEINGAIT